MQNDEEAIREEQELWQEAEAEADEEVREFLMKLEQGIFLD